MAPLTNAPLIALMLHLSLVIVLVSPLRREPPRSAIMPSLEPASRGSAARMMVALLILFDLWLLTLSR